MDKNKNKRLILNTGSNSDSKFTNVSAKFEGDLTTLEALGLVEASKAIFIANILQAYSDQNKDEGNKDKETKVKDNPPLTQDEIEIINDSLINAGLSQEHYQNIIDKIAPTNKYFIEGRDDPYDDPSDEIHNQE